MKLYEIAVRQQGWPAGSVGAEEQRGDEFRALEDKDGVATYTSSINIRTRGKNITSLQGMPDIVVGGVNIIGSSITSLEYAPTTIFGNTDLRNNVGLTSFKHSPLKFVRGDFDISNTNITSLVGMPHVTGQLVVVGAKLKNLVGCSESIKGLYVEEMPGFESLEGIPNQLNALHIADCNLPDNWLDLVPTSVTELSISGGMSLRGINKRTLLALNLYVSAKVPTNILGLCLLDVGTWHVGDYNSPDKSRIDTLREIVRKYIGQGKSAILDFQKELIAAGFEESAKL